MKFKTQEKRPRVGDPEYIEAFTEAYRTYYSRVFAYIYNRLNSVEVSQDLTAEVFEKAYLKGEAVRDPQAYRAWLFMIAKNTVAGYFRQQGRQRRSLDRIKESLSLNPGYEGSEPADRLMEKEAVCSLMEHLRLLSSREQELLALKFDGELTNEEIARVMGMSPVNVRVSIFRALAKLRERMKATA